MFAIQEIKSAHQKVKSGADFPAYINELQSLGVSFYKTHVEDGRTAYFDKTNASIQSEGGSNRLTIAPLVDIDSFQKQLKAHQNGQTDYPTFLADCAQFGVAYWKVDLSEKTCAYFGLEDQLLIEENITGLSILAYFLAINFKK